MSDKVKQGSRNSNHGKETERMVVHYLRENGYPDAETTRNRLGHNGTKQPGDVEFTPGVSLEVKGFYVNNTRWPSWQRQAVEQAGPHRIAAVVRRTKGNPRVGEWECRWNAAVAGPGAWAPDFWHVGTFAEFIASLEDDDKETK